MPLRFAISILLASLLLADAMPAAQAPAASSSPASSSSSQEGEAPAGAPADAPSEAEIHARAEKLMANQHNNDEVLDQYERLERYIDRTTTAKSRSTEDRTYRVVPTGGGTLRILVKNGDKLVEPAEYRRQMQLWESILEMMSRPNDSRARTAAEKYAKRKRERAQFVEAAGQAYLTTWVGREARNGRACDVFELRPNPSFRSRSMFQDALTHVTAKTWVDRETIQLVRGEAHVTSDISFGAGILGKLYRGGLVAMEQAEVAPGVWLPMRYEYDFSGRKFLFPFEQHQTIEASRYRYIGSLRDALAVARDELATGKPFRENP
ncbi:MAG: hypothetical protein LAN59_02575 [Acidobacteriia bacterium]|nr:hypothetical protein [Terriglobia bacterium]